MLLCAQPQYRFWRAAEKGNAMSVGLIALLDDVVMLARMAAASLDDVATQAAQAGGKAAGVVIDDAAVTPRYAIGFAAEREWPIIRKIAVGSLRNKLLVLLPAALALSFFAPGAITPLLMLGGAYLAYEGAEKIWEAVSHHHPESPPETQATLAPDGDDQMREDAMVAGAIRTDFVLSAEIMAITLGSVEKSPLLTQALVLFVVGVAITVAVYGTVALLVKVDDLGLWLALREGKSALRRSLRALGRGMVKAMPVLLSGLGLVGVAAMIWVGGGIIAHGLEGHGFPQVAAWLHKAQGAATLVPPIFSSVTGFVAEALATSLFGLAIGALLIPIGHTLMPVVHRIKQKKTQ
jgi:uncharacterized protein